MLLRNAIQEIRGLRFMVEQLQVRSGFARQVLLDSSYIKEPNKIQSELTQIEFYLGLIRNPANKEPIGELNNLLGTLKDIRGSIARLAGGQVLNDIELFEIKSFSMNSLVIGEVYTLPDLAPVVEILDPDDTQIPQFYIYDSYSDELAALRRKIKSLKEDDPERENLYYQSTLLEDRVRESLSERLKPYGNELLNALISCAELDIRLAKAQQAFDMNLCKPLIRKDSISFRGLFNPEIKATLEAEGKRFQPVDITIERKPSLITGANMTGKSVVLKTVALAQALFQYAFYLPAAAAQLLPVESLYLSVGDDQDELNGLSSFAAEMLKIDHIIQELKQGKEILVLIDEPARTTNPTEGKAIVNALVALLSEKKAYALVTTHYSGISSPCRKLRVKGLSDQVASGSVTVQNIDQYIDYALIEEKDDNVPHEAIRIARILGVDAAFLDRASDYLEN